MASKQLAVQPRFIPFVAIHMDMNNVVAVYEDVDNRLIMSIPQIFTGTLYRLGSRRGRLLCVLRG